MDYQYAKLPDGSYAKFSADKTPEQIKQILTDKGIIGGTKEEPTPPPKEEAPEWLQTLGGVADWGLEALDDARRFALHGVTMGQSDHLIAGTKAALTGENYDALLETEEQDLDSREERSPVASTLGTIVGQAAPTALVHSGLKKLGTKGLALAAGTGGVSEGAYQAGNARGDEDALEEGLIGAGIGAGTAGIGYGLYKAGSKVASHLKDQTSPIVPKTEEEALAFAKLTKEADGLGKNVRDVEDAWDVTNNTLKRIRGDWNTEFRKLPMKQRRDLENTSTFVRNQHNAPSTEDFDKVADTVNNPQVRDRLLSLMAQKRGLYDADLRSQQAIRPDILGNTRGAVTKPIIRYASETLTPNSWNRANRVKKGLEKSKFDGDDLLAKEKQTLATNRLLEEEEALALTNRKAQAEITRKALSTPQQNAKAIQKSEEGLRKFQQKRQDDLKASLKVDPKALSASQKGLKRLQQDRVDQHIQRTVNTSKEMQGSVLDDDNWAVLQRSLAPHWDSLKEAKKTGKGALGRLSKEIESPKDFQQAMKTALESRQPISYTDPKTGKLMQFVPDETDVLRAISNLKASKMGDVGSRAKAFYGYVADVAKTAKLENQAASAKVKKLAKRKASSKPKKHKSPIGGRLFVQQLNNGGLYGR